jgi:hypothetical protein
MYIIKTYLNNYYCLQFWKKTREQDETFVLRGQMAQAITYTAWMAQSVLNQYDERGRVPKKQALARDSCL